MRSELVSQAQSPVRNRYQLVHVASALTRRFHRPGQERVQESINRSLAGVGEGKYLFIGSVLCSKGGAHCVGCYDPETCQGIGIGPQTHHCAGCVLDDEDCTAIKMPWIPEAQELIAHSQEPKAGS
jgi:hypothetical protein